MHEHLVEEYKDAEKEKKTKQEPFMERANQVVAAVLKNFPRLEKPENPSKIHFESEGFTMSFSGFGEQKMFIPFKYFYLEDEKLEEALKTADVEEFKYSYHAG